MDSVDSYSGFVTISLVDDDDGREPESSMNTIFNYSKLEGVGVYSLYNRIHNLNFMLNSSLFLIAAAASYVVFQTLAKS